MQNTLNQCTRRFFFGTYNVVILLVIAGMTYRVFTNRSVVMSICGAIAGALAYMCFEAFAHQRMHRQGTIFFNSHSEHHLEKTPESGLPKPWLCAFYVAVAIVLSVLELPILQGFYLGLMLYLSIYEYVHFLCHCNYKAKTNLGWRIRVNHLKHHNHDDAKYFEMMFLRKSRTEADKAV